jgi:hypothetical protein
LFSVIVYIPIVFYKNHSKDHEKASWAKRYAFFHENVVQRSELFELAGPFGLNSIRYLVLAILLINLNYHVGYYKAENEKTYYSTSTNNIILREYGNYMISAKIIKSGPTLFYDSLNIINMKSVGLMSISKIKLPHQIKFK